MIRKFAAEIFQNAKKSAAELCQILRMVTIELVINSIRQMCVRVAISCRYCIAFEVTLLFLVIIIITDNNNRLLYVVVHNHISSNKNLNGMVWYTSLTSHSTQYRSFRRRGPRAVMYISPKKSQCICVPSFLTETFRAK